MFNISSLTISEYISRDDQIQMLFACEATILPVHQYLLFGYQALQNLRQSCSLGSRAYIIDLTSWVRPNDDYDRDHNLLDNEDHDKNEKGSQHSNAEAPLPLSRWQLTSPFMSMHENHDNFLRQKIDKKKTTTAKMLRRPSHFLDGISWCPALLSSLGNFPSLPSSTASSICR